MSAPANLGEAISRAVADQLNNEFVEKQVNTRVEKLVIEAVDNALRSYSETGKLIQQAVEAALKVDRIDLPSYGQTITMILREQIQAKVAELVAGRLTADMDELLGLAPKEVKLSAIAEDMLAPRRERGDWGDELITVIVEHNEYGSSWIYLDPDEHHPDRDKYRCPHRLLVGKDGAISGATIAGQDTTKATHIGRAYGFEQKLRAYVACGTKLILDENDVYTGIGE